MGNKGSKAADEQPQKNEKAQQPAQPAAPTQPTTPSSQQQNATSPTTQPAAQAAAQQNTAQNNPQSANNLQSGLDEFGNTDNISALDTYDHWGQKYNEKNQNEATPAASGNTAAAPAQNDDGLGGQKVRNKELQQTMRQTMRNTMCNGDLRQLVKLPPNADLNEWIALNTIHFYRTCSQIGETYRDLCTPQTCPLMSAGNVEYLWKDDKDYTKPTRVPACLYMEFALREAYCTIEDSSIFPADETQPFPKNFVSKVKEIFKRLFRQFAHLYYSHYDQVKQQGSSKHLNSTFKHFIYFVLEFQLIDQQTLSPLQKFIDHIVQNPTAKQDNTNTAAQ